MVELIKNPITIFSLAATAAKQTPTMDTALADMTLSTEVTFMNQ